MEVSGKRTQGHAMAASFIKASAEDFDFYCEPCDSEGTHVEAHGYCKICEEFLCTTCFTSHRRVRLTKNHILLDKEKMPKMQNPRKRESECTLPCPQHPQEIIIYYCKNHDVVGCHECMSADHSDCVNEFIPDIAEGSKDSFEYKAILKELDDVEIEARQKKRKANEDKSSADKCYTTVIEDMQKFKEDINAHLDRMERTLSAEARKAKENICTDADYTLDNCDKVESSVERMKENMSKTSVPYSQYFVHMKLSKTQLDSCKKILHKCETFRTFHTFKFENDADVEDKLKRNEKFGKLVFEKQTEGMAQCIMRKEVVLRQCGKLNVKSSRNIKDCDIFSIDMLSPQELVLADFSNMSVKIFCMQTCRVTHEMDLYTQPYGLTVLNKDKIAVVTCRSICSLRLENNLYLTNENIDRVRHSGIKCLQNKLVMLSSHPVPQLDVLNIEGEVLYTIMSDPEKRILKDPQHTAVSTDGKSIYVSDYRSHNKITRFSITGVLMNVYKNELQNDKLEQPRGIAVAEDGSVFVCDFCGNSIRIFSADLSNQRTILTEADGIKRPHSIHFCNRENKLFVANVDCNDILIYSLK